GQHASLRPAHKALAAKGELGCVTCHPAHGDARGVTFGQDGAYVAWAQGAEVKGALGHAAPAGATVPLVPLAVCAKCHDPSDVRHPIASCIVQGAPVATCFDEHQKADEPPKRALDPARCARQHGPGRYVAWEAAREIVENTPSPAPPKGAMPWAVVAIAFGAG